MNVDQLFRFQKEFKFGPSNKAEGADVHIKNGDDVSQKASWDAERRERQLRGRFMLRGGSDLIPRRDILIPSFVFPAPR